MKKLLSMALVTLIAATSIVGCGSKENNKDAAKSAKDGDAKKGSVYYLNFKPESDAIWQEIAAEFKKDTGIECKIVTAASGTYEDTLTTEITKDEAPTLFQINGPVGFENWKDYCADLTDTDFAKYMDETAKSLAVTEDGKVYGVPYAVEGYGIIYNDAIMKKYFASANKDASITIKSADEIKNFKTLKAVVEDMTKLKSELGIKGVFGATSLSNGNQWRWQTHLANLPLYYEAKDNNSLKCPDELKFTYNENFKNIFDLYINNSSTEKSKLSEATVDGSMAELALGECAMIQNGNWGWGGINGVKGNVVQEADVKFLPIYTGVEGEETQGICIGTENYYSINSRASKDDIAATLEFLEYVFNTEKGKDYVVNKLGFITPFNTFKDNEKPSDPLALEVLRYSANTELKSVPWVFATFPSEDFKNQFGGYLLNYTLGKAEWKEVVDSTITSWNTEVAKAANK